MWSLQVHMPFLVIFGLFRAFDLEDALRHLLVLLLVARSRDSGNSVLPPWIVVRTSIKVNCTEKVLPGRAGGPGVPG